MSTQDQEQRTMINECYTCKFKEDVEGNTHITCNNPDPSMTGKEFGIRNGWFSYPFNFDPAWKTKLCDNYELLEK